MCRYQEYCRRILEKKYYDHEKILNPQDNTGTLLTDKYVHK